ncbi:hypothetical protein [Legionella cincinnatiensis]|uniref:Uncharacterized protein n=1 Tax=Legionella cincinnatiensis TaxID=28085 RepID=A0A378IK71_9GAMM|nr:hypothetical protein [Legionella cincinnatiensis]KTC82112.1 hypothetical protein Lcin_3182 [Legionella cincinnatiensis]STX35413.1 Uncharacterised protein [Legionella cincinnatiensis]
MFNKDEANKWPLKDKYKYLNEHIEITRNKEMENEMLFFSTLSKKMREHPSKENLEALKKSDEKINEMINYSATTFIK